MLRVLQEPVLEDPSGEDLGGDVQALEGVHSVS